MTGIPAIALSCAPIIASNAVFSVRRASKGIDAIDEKPLYAAMNLDIAAGQTFKGSQATIDLLKESGFSISAAENIKNSSKFMKGLGNVVKFTAYNVNPLICVTSGVKVLGSDDKVDTAAREVINLSTMFGAEALAKRAVGMSQVGKDGYKSRNAFFESQLKALEDVCSTKKLFNKISLKYLPGIGKGLFFVAASIAGYTLGDKISDSILGKQCAKSVA